MHEMTLCEGILKILKEQSISQKFMHVKTVYLELGVLSHVSPEAMLFCFDVVVKDSLADGAKLEISRLPGQAFCTQCDAVVEIDNRGQSCPQCGGYQMRITGGDDMKIKELEVE